MTAEDWAEIRRLHRSSGWRSRQRTAAGRLAECGASRIAQRLTAAVLPVAEGSVVDAVKPRIRELLAATPAMLATVIAERIGWQHGLTVLKDRVRAG